MICRKDLLMRFPDLPRNLELEKLFYLDLAQREQIQKEVILILLYMGEILQLGYKFGFINDSSVWLLMLKKRNLSVNIYNEEDVEEMIVLIRDSFITAFVDLEKVLEKKVEEADESWES